MFHKIQEEDLKVAPKEKKRTFWGNSHWTNEALVQPQNSDPLVDYADLGEPSGIEHEVNHSDNDPDQPSGIDHSDKDSDEPLEIISNSEERLLQAAWKGFLIIVASLLEQKVPVDPRDKNSSTPLILASRRGYEEVVSLLLRHNAQIDELNRWENTALLAACHAGRDSTISTLLGHGANIESCNKYGTCNSGRRDVVEMLLNVGADVNAKPNNHWTPLHAASENMTDQTDEEHVDLIKYLIAKGAKLNAINDIGDTPLHVACRTKHPGAIEYLVRNGANIHQKNDDGETPFQLALEESTILNFEPLLYERPGRLRTNEKGYQVDPSIPNLQGKSALRLAVDQDHQNVVLCLLCSEWYYPKSPVRRCAYLASATELSHIEARLMQYLRVGELSQDEISCILYWSIANKREHFFKEFLVDRRNSVPYKGGMSLLHVAAQYGYKSIETEFLDQTPHQQTDQGLTALHASAAFGHLEATKSLLKMGSIRSDGCTDYERIIDMIVQVNIHRDSPFSLAVKGRHSLVLDHFWDELHKHAMLKNDFKLQNSERADRILELASRFREPRKEKQLLSFLLAWFGEPDPEICRKIELEAGDWKVLHHVVHRQRVVELWWLLVKGGHFEHEEMVFARRILEAQDSDETKTMMFEMLLNPPQIIGHEKAGGDLFTECPTKLVDLPLHKFQTTIVDFYAEDHLVDLQVIQRPLDDIVYYGKLGPAMRDAMVKDHRHLDSLKRDLKGFHGNPARPRVEGSRMEENVRSATAAKEVNLGARKFRWVHLPFNHVPYLVKETLFSSETIQEQKTSDDPPGMSLKFDLPPGSYEPMTLDQFYYPSFKNNYTNNDQVVAQYVERQRCEATGITETPQNQVEKTVILPVDQLWIRVLDDKTIISSSTNPTDPLEEGVLEQVQKFIMFERNGYFERPTMTKAMVEIILSVTTNLLLRQSLLPRTKETKVETTSKSKNVLEVFQESVRDIVDKEAKLYGSFVMSLMNESGSDRHRGFMRNIPKTPYHVITTEARLLRESKRIDEELNMLKTVLEGQQQVWQQVFKTDDLNTFDGFQYDQATNPTQLLWKIQNISEEASAVRESINDLLDWRQQQAGLKEAEFGRWQANVSLVFTVVAIVFLPLSFLTSLFALNVSGFPHLDGAMTFQGKWIFPMIFDTETITLVGISACVSIPFLMVAFNVNQAIQAENHRKSSSKDSKLAAPDQPQFEEQTRDSSHVESAFSRRVLELGKRRPRRLGDPEA
ncbi:Mg2+ transporter protein CorA-like/Zinc transport protein ZntB [Penicillium cf. viridicatum]|uniref:Mg2+ transporter protein CorA-like/Zinc transport protein ZntB n=1 Tax=Penicillium cf. viridicatum TaxID=2972119 RepID=A0A9W9N5N8_9EURO|nr:Mg2+ transporter protein CorA-like/Zinc transport protein ZntB [Penicillium cf. viridicatum]